ncbi:MAG: allophanate hydrolase-related protein [Sulfuriferula sp.]
MNDLVLVAVCGAHMSGLPLNDQLLRLNAKLVSQTTTSSNYRLYHLANFHPSRPGMVRVTQGGAAVNLEVWEVSMSNYGALISAIPAPLGIGRLELADGSWVQGFLCESYALEHAQNITSHGGWRQFLASADYKTSAL